jgi:hypothetical protein
MKFRPVLWAALGCLTAEASAGAQLQNHLSFEGYTGIINTPTAEVTPETDVDLQFNDQLESQYVHLYPRSRNFLFSMGVLPFLELGGRLASRNDPSKDRGDIVGGERDLSGNAKLQFPFHHKYLPNIAIGMQDFGGAANQFRSNYGVASKELGPLRLSLGYGAGPDRMRGVFGGIELKAFNWLYLLADNDSDESNLGLRVVTPRPLFGNMLINLTAKLQTTGVAEDFAWGVGLRIPLGNPHDNTSPLPGSPDVADPVPMAVPRLSHDAGSDPRLVVPQHEAPAPALIAEMPRAAVPDPAPPRDLDAALRVMESRLEELGFQYLRIGTDDAGGLYVQYDNVRYNHSFLDGMGLVLGVLADFAPDEITQLHVVATTRRTPLLRMSVAVELYREFLDNPLPVLAELRHSLRIERSSGFVDEPIRWIEPRTAATRTWLDVVIRPDIRTFVGTEFGAFDYSLSLRTDARFNLWRGALLNTTWDLPVSSSDDVKKGSGIFLGIEHDSGLQDVFLQQLFDLTPTMINMTSIGRHLVDEREYRGLWNETIWTPRSGAHAFRAKLGYFEDDDGRSKELWTGYYDFMWTPKDVVLSANYGQYWYGDRGMTFIARRFFGDTAVSAYIKYNGDKAGGLSISFPLTPRRDPQPGIVQVRGANRWAYGLQTSIGLDDNSNPIDMRIAVDSNTYYNVLKDVLDAGRLNAPYIRQHLLRLRDAYATWGAETAEK